MMIVMASRVGCNLFIQHFLKLYNLYIPNYTLIANVMSQPYFSLFLMSGISVGRWKCRKTWVAGVQWKGVSGKGGP